MKAEQAAKKRSSQSLQTIQALFAAGSLQEAQLESLMVQLSLEDSQTLWTEHRPAFMQHSSVHQYRFEVNTPCKLTQLKKALLWDTKFKQQQQAAEQHQGDTLSSQLATLVQQQTVDLRWHRISASHAQTVGELLQRASSLTIIHLQSNQLADEGAEAIAAALISNQTIKGVGLGTNCIADKGVISLVQMLHHNTHLQWLDLQTNKFGEASSTAMSHMLLKNQQLRQLWLGNNNLGDAAVCKILGSLKYTSTLETLDVSRCLCRVQTGRRDYSYCVTVPVCFCSSSTL